MNVQVNKHLELLIKSGLSELEAKIYLLLLEKNRLNGNQLAEMVRIERSLVYRALKHMLLVNLINSDGENYDCKYYIDDINLLTRLSDKNLQLATESLNAAKEFISKIPSINLEGILKSKVKVFKNEDSILKVYQERNASGDKVIREISSNTVFPEIKDLWWDEQIETRKKSGSFLQQLVDISDDSKHYHRTSKDLFKEVRQVPDDFKINSGINIYNNKVAFHNSSLGNPLALVIEDEDMAKLMKNIFDFIWNRSKVI